MVPNKRQRRRKARYNEQLRRKWVAMHAQVEMRLERAGHRAIRMRKSRAVIGQPYQHARLKEVLMTLRYRNPILVSLEQLESMTRDIPKLRLGTDLLYQHLERLARAWSRERPAVKHPKWREE